jgi:signal transduction histidine kinase
MRAEDSEQDWRDLSYDVGWEAAPRGVIRCKRVLNRRDDIFKAVEGLHPRALFCPGQGRSLEALLQDGHPLRHVEVRLGLGPQRLYVTARLRAGGGAIGTFSAVEPQSDEGFAGQATLLSHIAEARGREEIQRRETETMLGGLQILLGEAPVNEKLDLLAGLMMKALRGTSRLVLHIARDGAPSALAHLAETDTAVTLYRDPDPRAAALRALLAVRSGDVAALRLPVKSQSVVLLCAARRGFTAQDIDFAGRFALILRQALVLKDEQERLTQAAKLSALGQMAASLAHELRQPLNTISAAAQNLERLSEDGPVEQKVLRGKIARILGQVERAARIMTRINNFAHKSQGQFAPADIAGLADGVRVLMEHALTGVRLELDIEAGLSLRCDATGIEQLLVNLVRNALDAIRGVGSAGVGRDGVIIIRGQRVPDGILLRVEDNGPGFPPDVAERPLETFHTTKKAGEGTGLGLSISHMIAREHGGSLRLGNHAGGAFVELQLPERRT